MLIVGSRSNRRENTSRCIATLVSYGQPKVHQISYFDFCSWDSPPCRRRVPDAAGSGSPGERRVEERHEPLIVQRQAVHVGEDLHAERAQIGHRAFELGDALASG